MKINMKNNYKFPLIYEYDLIATVYKLKIKMNFTR